MHVSAKDKATGKEQSIRIEASSGISEEDIEKMVQEAEANAEADEKKKETVERRNTADSMVFQIEKQLEEYGEKIDPSQRAKLEEAVKNMKTALESNDDDEIKAKFEYLDTTWKEVGEEFYKQAQQADAETAEATPSEETDQASEAASDDDDTVDADFEVVDD